MLMLGRPGPPLGIGIASRLRHLGPGKSGDEQDQDDQRARPKLLLVPGRFPCAAMLILVPASARAEIVSSSLHRLSSVYSRDANE